MSILGAQLSGMEHQLLLNVQRWNNEAALHALRLSTEQRVSKPSHDPAAFVRISSFESQLQLLKSTKVSVDAASNVAADAQLVLGSIRTQLESIRDTLLEDEDLGLNASERATNQGLIDDAVDEIDSLARTETNGRRFLDGSSSYSISGMNSTRLATCRFTPFAARQSMERFQLRRLKLP